MDKELITEDELQEIKVLYKRAMSGNDKEAVELLAAEAASAIMYRSIVAEAEDMVTAGNVAEAGEILQSMGPSVAEAELPLSIFRDN